MSALALGLALATAATPGAPTLVLPPTGSPNLEAAWIPEAVADGLPRMLRELEVPAVEDIDRLRAHEALEIPVVQLTRATSVRIAEALGAGRIVIGSWDAPAAEVSLSLRLLDVERGTLSAPLWAAGPIETLPQLLRTLAWDIALAGSTPPAGTRDDFLRRAPRVPFDAYRLYARGLAAEGATTRPRLFKQALALFPGYDEARLALGRLQVAARDSAAAAGTLGRVSEASPLAREARFLQGLALLDLGRYREASAIYASLVGAEASAAVLNNYALALLRGGGGPGGVKASELLRQAAALSPSLPELPFNLGFALFVEGDAEAAAFWLRGVVREAPGDTHARVVLSWALRRSGLEVDADAEWKPLVARAPAYESLAQPDPSRRFERSVAWERPLGLDQEQWGDRQYAASHVGRAEKLTEAGDFDGALQELTQAAYLDPYGERAHLLLARAYRRRGDDDKAASELRMALWVRDDAAVRAELASLLGAMGKHAEAKAEAQRVLKTDPGNASARALLGKGPKP